MTTRARSLGDLSTFRGRGAARASVLLVAWAYLAIWPSGDLAAQPGAAPGLRLISGKAGATVPAAAASRGLALTPNGRFVLFESEAPDLVDGDTNGLSDVFLHDRVSGTSVRVSVSSAGVQGDGASFGGDVSDDGTVVVFVSRATNLVAGPAENTAGVFVRDLLAGTTTRVSQPRFIPVDPKPLPVFQSALAAVISGDGRFISWSAETLCAHDVELPPPGTPLSCAGVFMYDRQTGQQVPVGRAAVSDSAVGVGDPALSRDGRYLAYRDAASRVHLFDRLASIDSILPDLLATGDQACGSPSISGDGRYVAYACHSGWDSRIGLKNLQTGDVTPWSGRTPSVSDSGRHVAYVSGVGDHSAVRVHDSVLGVDAVVSRHLPFTAGYRSSFLPAIDASGEVVMFTSASSNMVPDDVNDADDVFLSVSGGHACAYAPWATRTTFPASPGAFEATGHLSMATAPECPWTAAGDVPWITFAGATTRTGNDGLFFTVAANPSGARTGALLAGGAALSITQAGAGGTTPPPTDSDADGLPDEWETRFGLSPSSAGGPDGPSGDPDGDGVTNVAEFRGGTHPRGFHTRYFAEGAATALFDTRLALLNVTDGAASVLLRFLKGDGTTSSHALTVGPRTRATVSIHDLAEMRGAEFSTVVESDQALVADRTMTWDAAGYGSHAETGVLAPATMWYLAEGATHSGFDLFYLLQNPSEAPATVQVRYLLPDGLPVVKTYPVAPRSRFNIWVDADDPRLADTDVSAVLSADVPIIVERAMYLSTPTQVFVAGHESAGVTAPATEWFLAEGATGPFFDLFILIANPNGQDASVDATFLLPSGTSFTRSHVVKANTRFNIWVDQDPWLADTAVSTIITSTNGVPVIVERAMWWPGPTAATWTEAHNSAGLTSTGRTWAVADGEVGGERGTETYLLIANRGRDDRARVTLYYEDGSLDAKEFALPASSRTNVAIAAEFASAHGRRFGAVVEALGDDPHIAVERAMYSSLPTQFWAAGTNAVATRLR